MAERGFTERGKAFVVKHYGTFTNFFRTTRAAPGEQQQAERQQAAEQENHEFLSFGDGYFAPTLSQGENAAQNSIELKEFEHHHNGGQNIGLYHTTSRDAGISGSKFYETGLHHYDFVEYHMISAGKMPKSNPFNYENRRNSGAPLGVIIGENFKKQLEKQAKSARKMSGASATSTIDTAEKNIEHPVLLIVPGKKLSDEGVAAMVAGIEEALKAGTRGTSLVIEEIDLRNNELTTVSLSMLAPIIDLSRLHLKTLTLSGNAIRVSTDEEAQQFETFLVAFRGCMMLRCVDLSGNTDLGTRAFEVLAKVHNREPAIDPVSALGERVVVSASQESLAKTDAPHVKGQKVGVTGGYNTMFDSGYLQRRCGLRSLPYLEVHNVGLNDAGALWLSFTLQDHYLPSQLTTQHNAVSADTSHPAYSQGSGVDGINWIANNETLGKEGLKVLKQSEDVRKKTLLEETTSVSDPYTVSDVKTTTTRRPSKTGAASDNASQYTLRSDIEIEDPKITELESIRKKLQRQIIEHDGVGGAELYRVAVAAVTASRKLSYMAPITRKLLGRPVLLINDTSSDEATPQPKTQRLDSVTSVTDEDVTDAQQNYKTETPHSSLSRNKGRSYAATLAAINVPEPGGASLAITEVTNTPTTPKRTFKAHRKGGFSEGSDMDLVNQKLASVGVTIEREDSPERYIKWQRKYYGEFEYRNTAFACHLPLAIFNKVMEYVVGKGALSALNEEQERAAYAWGQNKATLATEEEWLKHQESAQKWMLLEAVGCLSYAA